MPSLIRSTYFSEQLFSKMRFVIYGRCPWVAAYLGCWEFGGTGTKAHFSLMFLCPSA
jgi:hypothetical protein